MTKCKQGQKTTPVNTGGFACVTLYWLHLEEDVFLNMEIFGGLLTLRLCWSCWFSPECVALSDRSTMCLLPCICCSNSLYSSGKALHGQNVRYRHNSSLSLSLSHLHKHTSTVQRQQWALFVLSFSTYGSGTMLPQTHNKVWLLELRFKSEGPLHNKQGVFISNVKLTQS